VIIVSSFNEDGFKKYGKKFLESWAAYWPDDVQLVVYYHDFKLPIGEIPVKKNIEYRNLNLEFKGLEAWRTKYKHSNGDVNGKYNYRFDAIKFSHKIFALNDAALKLKDVKEPGHLVWLDADTITTKKVDADNFLFSLPEADLFYLGRRTVNYSETSFIAFNLNGEKAWEFIADMRDTYMSGELFSYAEWHDGFVFERLLNVHRWHGLKAITLSDPTDLDAFNSSPLGSFMQHFKGPKAKEAPQEMPVKIYPVNAAEDKQILGNIKKNKKLIKKWLVRNKPHDTIGVMLSAGPSLEKDIPEIKNFLKKNPKAKVFCVKHALPLLLKNGIVPWACVLLDARNFKGVSTHGFKRKELLAVSPRETNYFAASMVDPAMVRFLQKKERNVIGWHAYTAGVEKLKISEDMFYIVGGTCAAIRMISLAHVMGFNNFHLWGYDSCMYDTPDLTKKDDRGRPMYMKAGAKGTGQAWFTTGELMAQAQDLETLWKTASEDMSLNMHGDGLGPLLVSQIQRPKKTSDLPEFTGQV
tara:strand:- start:768 stop:2342 length:1575 start_codon:yes stop_codon:yes gene_type:complete